VVGFEKFRKNRKCIPSRMIVSDLIKLMIPIES
jgi:hypothetical protein